MGRLDDSIVRQDDERRTAIDNNTVMMAGMLGEIEHFQAVASSELPGR